MKNTMTNEVAGYIARSNMNPKMYLATNGEFHHDMHLGPGGYNVKIFKTAKGAASQRGGTCTAVPVNAQGVILEVVS